MKKRITLSVDGELLGWLDKKIETRIFSNRSHGIEHLIARKRLPAEGRE